MLVLLICIALLRFVRHSPPWNIGFVVMYHTFAFCVLLLPPGEFLFEILLFSYFDIL